MELSRRSLLKAGLATIATAPATPLLSAEQGLIRKPIPSSGETIPVVGIGTNRYGVGDDKAALAPLRETLKSFANIDGGVIDTAPMYGSSESVLGRLIGEINAADRFFVATKCDVGGGKETREQLASSAQKLRSGKLDLVAVHNLKAWRDQLPVLREAKQAGSIKYVGITTSRERQYVEFEAVLRQEPLDFMQINYSLADRNAEPLLQLASERGVAVMINLPFGRGRLFSSVEGQPIPAWAAEIGIDSWGQFFLRYVISHPAVTCAIPGTRKPHHLEDNLNAARGSLLSAKQRTMMEQWFDQLTKK
jgi:aryl-alcohol dehydrogenase-like predicted oxidoreductase